MTVVGLERRVMWIVEMGRLVTSPGTANLIVPRSLTAERITW